MITSEMQWKHPCVPFCNDVSLEHIYRQLCLGPNLPVFLSFIYFTHSRSSCMRLTVGTKQQQPLMLLFNLQLPYALGLRVQSESKWVPVRIVHLCMARSRRQMVSVRSEEVCDSGDQNCIKKRIVPFLTCVKWALQGIPLELWFNNS